MEETSAEAYLGLADVYIRQGDYEKAVEVLQQGVEKTGDEALQTMLDSIFVGEANEPERNAYGATKFELRPDYFAFSDMTLEERQVIETIGNAALLNDTTTLYSLLDNTSMQHFSCYTIWNGYKVKVGLSSYSITNDGDQRGAIGITLRPESGTGYYCSVYLDSATTISGRDHWWDYFYSENWITCPCIDWQWSGTLNRISQIRSLYRSQDGFSSESVTEETESGTMVNCLRDGIFTRTVHEVNKYGRQSLQDYDGINIYTNIYRNGVLVEQNGEPQDGTHVGVDIEGAGYSYDPNSQLYLDEFYW